MRTLFAAWSAEVEKDGWEIASLNQSLHRWQPSGGGGAFEFTLTANAECCGPLALQLMRGLPESTFSAQHFNLNIARNPFELTPIVYLIGPHCLSLISGIRMVAANNT